MKRVTIDERREVLVAKNEDEAYDYFVQVFAEEAKRAVAARGCFNVALSGGKTPIPFYERFKNPSVALMINWPLVNFFWGDERCVPPTSSDSNWGSAIPYFSIPPLDGAHKHRLKGEAKDLDKAASSYENEVKKICPQERFDLVILGMGEDGHTASLFPNTEAIKETSRLFVPNTTEAGPRLTMTFPAIDSSRSVWVLAFGRPKAKTLKKCFFGPTTIDETPCNRLGTKENPVHFLIDRKAAYGLGL